MKTVTRMGGLNFAAALLSTALFPLSEAGARDDRFEKLSVHLERNVQDHDAEIRFEVTSGEDGLAALSVTAPGDRKMIELKTPDSKLGLRQIIVESPEPDDDRVVRTDFPPGPYRFEGKTTKGAILRGEAKLSHVFPKPALLEYPRPGQRTVAATSLTLRWSAPNDIKSCIVVIEQPGSPYEIRALLPVTTKSFTVPEGFLRAGQRYKFAIGTVAKDGNSSFIEGDFVTESQ